MDNIVIGRKYKNLIGYSNIYVGRPSILGNPFAMHCEADRANVIKEYRHYLIKHYKENTKVWQEITKLAMKVKKGEKLNLQCFCSPKPCHADVIKSAILFLLKAE